MGDAIRITVIATGFEHSMPMMRPLTRTAVQPHNSGGLRRESVSVSSQASAPVPASRVDSDSATPYRVNDLDVPAFLRKKR